jgi:DNA-binding XRE family transcriptional regulator
VKSQPQTRLSKETLAHLAGVGANLSLIRRSLGLTQTDMAKAADMGASTLIAIEKGSAEVSLRHWLRAMEVLGLETGVQGFGSLGPNTEIIASLAQHVPKRGGGRSKRTGR